MHASDDSVGSADESGVEPDLGTMLRAARDAQGLSIEEIAAELRIEVRLLESLEAGRFDELGPPVFAKGYLKHYGQRLGLDYKDLLSAYYHIVEPREVEITASRVIKLRDERQVTIWVIAIVTLVLLAGLLLYWWLNAPDRAPSAAVPADRELAPLKAASLPARPPDPAPVADLPARERPAAPEGSADSPSSETQAATAAQPEVPQQAQAVAAVPGAADSAAFAAALRPRPEPQESSPVAASPSERAAAAEGPSLTIDIEFLADCWTEITGADGERAFYDLGHAGTARSMTVLAPARVFLGNANGVALLVDGQPYRIPAAGRRGDLANFTLAAPAD